MTTICDEDGVPKLVQSIDYASDRNLFRIKLFDGRIVNMGVSPIIIDLCNIFGGVPDCFYVWAESLLEEVAPSLFITPENGLFLACDNGVQSEAYKRRSSNNKA